MLLDADDVFVLYGKLQALSGVSLSVEAGEIHGLIGPNGSGKTTLLNAICGFIAIGNGRIRLNGAPIDRLPVHRRAALGLARTFQGAASFEEMRGFENVLVGLHLWDGQTFWRACLPYVGDAAAAKNRSIVMKTLDRVGIGDVTERLARTLNFGAQRMLDLARATAGTPKLLLLDEPAAGLNANEVAHLAEIIRTCRAAGVTVVLVEHHLKLVLGLCDRVTVLNFGKTIAAGSPDQVRRDPAVIEAYLGPQHDDASPR